MKKTFIISLIAIIACNFAIAQRYKVNKLVLADLSFTDRVSRIVQINDTTNQALELIYDHDNNLYGITEVINNAIIKHKVKLYHDTKKDTKRLTEKEMSHRLKITYDSIDITNATAINHIIIEEDSSLNIRGKTLWSFKWFQLCLYNNNGISVPIYTLKATDFLNLIREYHIYPNGKELNLAVFFEERLFESEILGVLTTKRIIKY